jgi:hypothetical protein
VPMSSLFDSCFYFLTLVWTMSLVCELPCALMGGSQAVQCMTGGSKAVHWVAGVSEAVHCVAGGSDAVHWVAGGCWAVTCRGSWTCSSPLYKKRTFHNNDNGISKEVWILNRKK